MIQTITYMVGVFGANCKLEYWKEVTVPILQLAQSESLAIGEIVTEHDIETHYAGVSLRTGRECLKFHHLTQVN